MGFWSILKDADIHASIPRPRRVTLLTNWVSLVSAFLGIILLVAYLTIFKWDVIAQGILIMVLLIASVPIMNHYGFTTLSRFWLCFIIPAFTLALSVMSKLGRNDISEPEFYDYRFILLSASVFPFILFKIKEIYPLIIAILLNAACLLLFDPIHNAFGIGYHQVGKLDTTYYFTNIIILVSYLSISIGLIFLKRTNALYESARDKLIIDLNATRKSLEQMNTDLSAQNMEYLVQSKKLKESQVSLSQAYDLIEEQKNLLSREKKDLELEVFKKNRELSSSNEELVKHNNELRQFSHAVSHNLRGPIASLLGLLHLLEGLSNNQSDEIITHLKNTVYQLDDIARDLSNILGVREEIFKIRQRVSLKNEIDHLLEELKRTLESSAIRVKLNLEIDEMYTLGPMIHNILHQLIGNSIKYRAHNRQSIIEIRSAEDDDHYLISISDNGLGIDLNLYRQDLFKLYKRFHTHTEGKGLGLYLVKLQCELLGGEIHVDSVVNESTTFTIYLKKNQIDNREILYSQAYAYIFYDPEINATGVVWLREVQSMEYRKIFNKCLEQLQIYNTPNWISDVTNLGAVLEHDQEWLRREIIPLGMHYGLQRVAMIKNTNDSSPYLSHLIEEFRSPQFNMRLFMETQDAIEWIRQENTKEDAIINE